MSAIKTEQELRDQYAIFYRTKTNEEKEQTKPSDIFIAGHNLAQETIKAKDAEIDQLNMELAEYNKNLKAIAEARIILEEIFLYDQNACDFNEKAKAWLENNR